MARRATALLVTDLDGTLLDGGTAHPRALDCLRGLPALGVVRVAATGRSTHAYRRLAFAEAPPLDYLIVSSGAGIFELPSGKVGQAQLLHQTQLQTDELANARRALEEAELDFMIHPPVPGEHRFAYRVSAASRRSKAANPDFWRRVELHPEAEPLPHGPGPGEATGLLAVVPEPHGEASWRSLKERLPRLTVLRTTSPLDGASTWIEIFPETVSKSQSSAWLARRLGIPWRRSLCLGNDFNDLDLLAWGATAFVVEDSPIELSQRYAQIPGPHRGGVADGVRRWLPTLPELA